MTLFRRAAGAILFAALAGAGAADGDGRVLLDVRFTSPFQREALLRSGIDVWCGDIAHAVVYARPDEVVQLRADGFTFEPLDDVLAAQKANAARSPAAWPTFDQYLAIADGWASAHPGLAHAFTIGTSHEGRAIRMVRLSDNAATDENEPEILLMSLQHAREWLAGTTLRGIAERLLAGYGTDPQITALLDGSEVYVLLVANPDGYVHSHTTDRFWRKNRRPVGMGLFGVDLNRNWPRMWQASPNLSGEDYPGPSALSEPENVVLNAWMTAPSRRLACLVNYHTFGAMAVHPWAHTATFAPNLDVVSPLVQLAAADIEGVHGQRMRWGPWSTTLGYTGTGETSDYASGTLGVPGFTIELRPGIEDMAGFAPDPSAIPLAVDENFPAAMRLIQWAAGLANDAAAAAVTGVAVSRISDTEATVTWKTNVPAAARVAWGTTLPFANEAQPHRLAALSHSVRIAGLAPSTTYSYQAIAKTLAGTETFSPKGSFATAATPQDIEPPPAPIILSAAKTSGGSVQVRWNPAATGLAGHRLYESSDLATWALVRSEAQLTSGTTSALLAGASGALRHFRLTNVDDSPARNESVPSDTYSMLSQNTTTHVAIVDGFDDWTQNPVSQGGNNDFAAWHGVAVAAHGMAFDTYADDEFGIGNDPAAYDVVVWALGHEEAASRILQTAMGPIVAARLRDGGNVFATGSDIAAALSDGTPNDGAFLRDVLCADFAADAAGSWTATPVAGDIFSPEPLLFDDGSRGVYRVADADTIAPRNGAQPAFVSGSGATIGIVREGLFGEGALTAKLVYLTFPFETISPAERRSAVMAEVLEYFLREDAEAEHWMLR